MGIVRTLKDKKGQMTVELMATVPVVLIIGLIAVNAGTFMSECAVFDRVFCEAVRVHATSVSYGSHVQDAVNPVKEALVGQLSVKDSQVDVYIENDSLGLYQFKATLLYRPSLFGSGFREEVFGMPLPHLKHSVSYTIESYRPGVII